MFFYILLVFSVKSCYKNNFWVETNEKQLKEVNENELQNLKFGEKYWFESSDERYIFSCSLNVDSSDFACLLIRQNYLLLCDLGIMPESTFSPFFRLASFQINKEKSIFYNLATKVEQEWLKGSLQISSNGLEARATHKLKSFKNLETFLTLFNWTLEKRFELLQKDKLYCVVYAEYLVINYISDYEEGFSRTEMVFLKTFCFEQHNYSDFNQVIWFSMLKRLMIKKGMFGDTYIYGLPYNQKKILKICFEEDNYKPVFEIEGESVKPIEEKGEIRKMKLVGIKSYLVLEKESKTPRFRVTLPRFSNDFGQTNANVLVFMLFSGLNQIEDGYKEVALELLSIKEPELTFHSKCDKIYFHLSVKQTKDKLSIELTAVKEKLGVDRHVCHEIKCEELNSRNLDKEFFNTDFVKYFNGAIVTANKLEKIPGTNNRGAKKSSNIKIETKVLLLVLGFCVICSLVVLVLMRLIVLKINKTKKERRRYRKTH